jgi:hypothetical protein
MLEKLQGSIPSTCTNVLTQMLTLQHSKLYQYNYKIIFQQMNYLLKHKMLQFLFKYFFTHLVDVSVPFDRHQGANTRTLLKLQSL